MKHYWEQLKPNERRVVVIVGFAFFIVLNAWFVWPHFTDLRRDLARMQAGEKTLATYQATVAHKAEYERKIRDLQNGGGSQVLPEDQAIDLMRFYDQSAIANQVQVQNNSGVRTRTNTFFLDQEVTLNVMAREKGLVGFLYSMGTGNSMVRVRNMSLRPDQSHQQINASITIIASYQKNPPPAKQTVQPPPAKVVASAKPPPANLTPVASKPKSEVPPNRPAPRFLKSAVTNKPGQ